MGYEGQDFSDIAGGVSPAFIDALYQRYKSSPDSVEPQWRSMFEGLEGAQGPSWASDRWPLSTTDDLTAALDPTQMEPAPHIAGSDLVVGIVKMQERMIILLDFEKILADVNPEMNQKMSAVPHSTPELVKIRQTKTILIAEDSKMLRELLLSTLHTAGYNTISNENGLEAWTQLEALAESGKPVTDTIQLIITDIEMPQMDGHHLIKRIKSNSQLKELPVIIFSSLINDEMKLKGQALGAYAQVTKPEIEQLIGIVDRKIAF